MRMRSCLVLRAQPPARCLLLASGANHSARTRTILGYCMPSCSSLEVPCGLLVSKGRGEGEGGPVWRCQSHGRYHVDGARDGSIAQ